ncbi:MAG: hypothetical protein JWR51_4628 [Devosia sp.]|uniref:hypothetical protein n=1 Tax=Devosia sp. TaxID=1871048 RepID=UPI00262E1C7B|nr:hypothetical protein [Devosia sp.]MDB5531525.1 hypothetical protein [Devosia sp.]
MAGPLYFDRAQETTTTSGTGAYTLAGAVAGFQSFAAVGNGNTCYYAATDGVDWEVGLGTYTAAGTTLARTTILASSNANAAVNWSGATKNIWVDVPAAALAQPATVAPLGSNPTAAVGTSLLYARQDHVHPGRQKLSADQIYSVGANIPTPSISIATPAVVTSTAHGLSANSPVVFNVPLNTVTATVSAANPAVVTMTNSFAAGQPVTLASTGSLPIPMIDNTTYYVIAAGLSGSSFQISATVGGAAINTSAPTATFTNGSANIGITTANTYLSVGKRVRFATSGSLPTNFATGTDYFVLTASSTLITVSATNGGSAIVAGSAGSGTQTVLQAGTHYLSRAGSLPTGVTAGTTYYVLSSGLTSNAFQFSTSIGGAAVNTSGSVTGSPVYGAYTGNDANDGVSGPVLTIQRAWDFICDSVDLGGKVATVKMADGVYAGGVSSSKAVVGGSGPNSVIFEGNTTYDDAVVISTNNAACFEIGGGVGGNFQAKVRYLKMQTATGGNCLNIFGGACYLQFENVVFGVSAGYHIFAGHSAFIIATGGYRVTGNAQFHLITQTAGQIAIHGQTVTTPGALTFTIFLLAQLGGQIFVASCVFAGTAISGQRYNAQTNGIIDAGGGGANFVPGNSAGGTSTGGQYG